MARIHNCGWKYDKTLFVEIPYSVKNGVGIIIIRDYLNDIYYRALMFTECVLDKLVDNELKFVVDHENFEIDDFYSRDRKGTASYFTNEQEEAKRHDPEMERLYDKYGKDMATDTQLKCEEICKNKQIIPPIVANFWLCLYAINSKENLIDCAFKMTKNMLSDDQKIGFLKLLNDVEKLYEFYDWDMNFEETLPFYRIRSKFEG